MTSLRQRTVAGLGWSAATQVLSKALQFAATAMMARLLSPEEFGLIGMVLVVTGLASSIADAGLGASIIQKQALSDNYVDSVFWLSIAGGVALTIAFSLAAPMVANLYSEPQLQLLTEIVALNFILNSTIVVQNALLQKSLDFRSRLLIELVSISASLTVALVLALLGAGVWSLAGQLLCGSASRSAVIWWLSSWRPRLIFDLGAVKEALRFARHLVGFGIVGYCAQNFGNFVIGLQIGSSELGMYTLSDRLMRLPLTSVTDVTGAVMFPALSILQSNVESMKRAYLRATRMIALVSFPMMLGLVVLAEPAILVVYGDRWRNVAGIVQLLAFAGLAQSVYNTAGWIFLSRGRTDIQFRLGVWLMLVRIVGVLVGMRWGIFGIAFAYVLGSYVFLLYPAWSAAGKLIDLRFADLLKNVAGPFYCAGGMAIVIWLSDQWLLPNQLYWFRLVVCVPTGIIVYGLLLRCFQIETWNDVLGLIHEARTNKGA